MIVNWLLFDKYFEREEEGEENDREISSVDDDKCKYFVCVDIDKDDNSRNYSNISRSEETSTTNSITTNPVREEGNTLIDGSFGEYTAYKRNFKLKRVGFEIADME